MADRLSSEERSRNMSRVKGRDTKPERLVRSLIHGMGYRFRLHRKDLPGRPDIVLPRFRKVVFVHGCFWHSHAGCPRAGRPTSNIEFWNAKIDRNIERDIAAQEALKQLGWDVAVIWQCEMRDEPALAKSLAAFMRIKRIPVKRKRPIKAEWAN
jgi:DNA mismatch endonuclease (patch repair protein)